MKLSIVSVNYKSQQYLQKCLDSLRNHLFNELPFEVIIVNNDSEMALSYENYPFQVSVFNNKINEGFGKGSNLGATKAQGEYLFFLNPDSIIEDASLLQLIKQMDQDQDIGIMGPKIVEFSKNRPQPWTCGKKANLLSILFKNTINKPWNKKIPTEVDWVSGTALLIKKDMFKKMKGFDKNIFMYFEDQDLCLRVKKADKKIVFNPQAHITHYDGKSWGNNSKKKKSFYESQTYFFKKHNGPLQTSALCFLRKITKGG